MTNIVCYCLSLPHQCLGSSHSWKVMWWVLNLFPGNQVSGWHQTLAFFFAQHEIPGGMPISWDPLIQYSVAKGREGHHLLLFVNLATSQKCRASPCSQASHWLLNESAEILEQGLLTTLSASLIRGRCACWGALEALLCWLEEEAQNSFVKQIFCKLPFWVELSSSDVQPGCGLKAF